MASDRAPVDADLVVDVDWPYDAALDAMHAARDRVIAGGRPTVFVGSHRDEVITLGRHTPETQLLGRAALEKRGVIVRRIERGGGATAHGPGQLVVYPVVHLERAGFDVPRFTRALLDAAVDFAGVGVVSLDPAGVYVACDDRRTGGSADPRAAGEACVASDNAKLASIGMRVQNGVVTHGLAINCVNDVSLFDLIAPCGISNQRMASLASLARVEHGASLIDLARRLALHVARRCVLRWT